MLLIATCVLAGCEQQTVQSGNTEFAWAQAALARNPEFEVVAADAAKGTFEVRDKTTGKLHTLHLRDLVATPSVRPRVAPVPAVEREDAAVESGAQVAANTTQPAREAATPAPAPAADTAAKSAVAQTTPAEGDVLAEGPGYKITRMESAPAATSAATAASERRSDPIICQGNRLMRIDDETLDFDGDALIVERGCDLYISNARIRASGVGIIARQARVHIVNSTIEGARGSYEVSDGAELYVARSTFTGIGRRFDSATMNDLGGNAFQMN
jgi:hypothetical protein